MIDSYPVVGFVVSSFFNFIFYIIGLWETKQIYFGLVSNIKKKN